MWSSTSPNLPIFPLSNPIEICKDPPYYLIESNTYVCAEDR